MASMRELLKRLVGVRIELDGVEYPNAYSDDLSVDRSNLEAEFLEHAERYAYYATLSELADDRSTRLKEDLDTLFAAIDHEKRQKADVIRQQDPKFKMTEAMFEHEVKLDPRYQAKLKEMQDARHLSKVLKSAPIAFAHRRDMLIELGKLQMSSTDPRIVSGKREQVRALMQGAARAAQTQSAPSLPAPERQELAEPLFCSVCRHPQEQTDHGLVCQNGHGGVPSLTQQEMREFSTTETTPAPSRRRAPKNAQ